MAKAEIIIKVDADWMALNAYRMALERIAYPDCAEWECNCEQERAIAERVLEQFPGSFRGRGGHSE